MILENVSERLRVGSSSLLDNLLICSIKEPNYNHKREDELPDIMHIMHHRQVNIFERAACLERCFMFYYMCNLPHPVGRLSRPVEVSQ